MFILLLFVFAYILSACSIELHDPPSQHISSAASTVVSDAPRVVRASAIQAGIEVDLTVDLDTPESIELPAELAWSDGSIGQVLLPFVDGVAVARVPLGDPCDAVDSGSASFVLYVGGDDLDVVVPMEGDAVDASAGEPIPIGYGLTVVCNPPQGVAIPLEMLAAGTYTFALPVGRGLVLRHVGQIVDGISFVEEARLSLDDTTANTFTVRGDTVATITL
jgi:hypothetical protein